jgi:hypothetical protein
MNHKGTKTRSWGMGSAAAPAAAIGALAGGLLGWFARLSEFGARAHRTAPEAGALPWINYENEDGKWKMEDGGRDAALPRRQNFQPR